MVSNKSRGVEIKYFNVLVMIILYIHGDRDVKLGNSEFFADVLRWILFV